MAYLQGFGPEGDYLRSRFSTQWKTARSYTDAQMGTTTDKTDVRVAWGNKNFTPPDNVPWVRVGIQHSGADPASVGDASAAMHRHDGMVIVEVFVPLDAGEGDIDDLCDDVADIFRDHSAQQGLRLRSPYTVTVGQTGAWYKKNVLIPFVRDTVFT
ncbi:MAG: DUF4128 domain-containing protein [Acidobacteria bacterium]|nr:DUF4128 domain-containing protein [Acidobacteriota bacterium]